MNDWREQEVENETRSREINEWIDEANQSGSLGAENPFVCECSDASCTATIRLTHVEYEEVREHGRYPGPHGDRGAVREPAETPLESEWQREHQAEYGAFHRDNAFRGQSILSPRIASTRSRMCPRRNWYVSS